MGDGGTTRQDLDATLTSYLQSWGLREFHDEVAYYEWQRGTLSSQDLQLLQSLVEHRQGGENEQVDIQFYNLLAKQPLLAVIYSQRFDYFRQIGLCLSPRVASARHVLDFGCGVGILTCWFAQQYPDLQFVGIDRSSRSIEMAQEEANRRHLRNVQFRVSKKLDVQAGDIFDCILSTQALLQSEREPGLPSRDWRTFEREHQRSQQEDLETRTGLNSRLAYCLQVLSPHGRIICFEKTWNLGRRIFFQRALSAKNLFPICDPIPCSYHELGESRIDGPLYELSRFQVPQPYPWNEAPFVGEGETLYRCVGDLAERMSRELETSQDQEIVRGQHASFGPWSFRYGVWEEALAWGLCETASGFYGLLLASEREKSLIAQVFENIGHLTESDFAESLKNGWGVSRAVCGNEPTPGYENHFPSAEEVYKALPRKIIQQESTFSGEKGREMHIEVGTTNTFRYLYWANTFDQRQLILTDEKGAEMLNEYYQESLAATQKPS